MKEIELQDKNAEQDTALFSDGTSINSKDCWICYDSERQDAGPLIQPCQCRGDVSAVHHNCLRRWLVEVKYKIFSFCRGTYHVIICALCISEFYKC